MTARAARRAVRKKRSRPAKIEKPEKLGTEEVRELVGEVIDFSPTYLPHKAQPVEVTELVIHRVLDMLSRGMTLVSICRLEDMPTYQAVMRLRDENPFFYDAFEKASEIGGRVIGEMSLQVVLDETDPNNAYLVRVKSDALYRHAKHMAPRVFGDKATVASDAAVGVKKSITIDTTDPQAASRAYQKLIAGEGDS